MNIIYTVPISPLRTLTESLWRIWALGIKDYLKRTKCQQLIYSNIARQPQEAIGQAPLTLDQLTGGQRLLLAKRPPNEAIPSPHFVQKLTINRVTVHYTYLNIH